ncbi:MAG: hypothetical protein ACR2HF_08155, partial [Methylococcaceae bacterium]
TPDVFRFASRDGVQLQQTLISAPIIITGLESTAPIRVINGEYALNGGAFTAAPGVIRNGDAVQVRLVAAKDYGTAATATLVVGEVSGSFTATTQAALPPDTVPEAFRFDDQNGVAVNAIVLSNPVVVSGITVATPISISGGFYAVNGGAFSSAPGTVNAGDSVQVRVFAAELLATPVTARVDIGGVMADFTVTTEAPAVATTDTQPDPFRFTAQNGVEVATAVSSNPVAITGINAASPIKISGGLYALNGGTYTGKTGTVNAGDVVQVQVTSAKTYNQTVTATLTIGGVASTFSATTRNQNIIPSSTTGSVDWSRGANLNESLQPLVSGGISYGQAMASLEDTLWIGAPAATSKGLRQRGIVYTWKRGGDGDYSETGVLLSEGKAGDLFGSRLAATPHSLLISAPSYDRDSIKDIGRVYVYAPDGGTTPVQILEAPELYAKAGFGQTLAVYGDWLAVGAPGLGKDDGRVYVYLWDNGQWVYQHSLKAPGKGGRFGQGLALSGDWLMVGAPKAVSTNLAYVRSGWVYGYTLVDSHWQEARINSIRLPRAEQFRAGELGAELSLNGTTLAVAAPKVTIEKESNSRNLANTGVVFTFSLDGISQVWQLDGRIEMDQPYFANGGSLFGSTLKLSEDGHWLVIGAPGADQDESLDGDNQFDIGRVFIYRLGGQGWTAIQMLKGRTGQSLFGKTVWLTPNTLFTGSGKGIVGAYGVE